MEADVGEVGLRHLQQVARLGEEDIATVLVLRHIVGLAVDEVLELLLVV